MREFVNSFDRKTGTRELRNLRGFEGNLSVFGICRRAMRRMGFLDWFLSRRDRRKSATSASRPLPSCRKHNVNQAGNRWARAETIPLPSQRPTKFCQRKIRHRSRILGHGFNSSREADCNGSTGNRLEHRGYSRSHGGIADDLPVQYFVRSRYVSWEITGELPLQHWTIDLDFCLRF